MWAATGLAIASVIACGDLDLNGDVTLSTDQLLVLPSQAGAPAVPLASFSVPNPDIVVRRLEHLDPFNTLYMEIRFPEGSLASLNGQPLTATDTVTITIEPRAGGYGMTVSPRGVAFASGATPSVTFAFARYGDLSVANGSQYATPVAYAAALALWFEVTPGRWRRVSGSGPVPTDAVASPLPEPGTYVIAAPR